MSEERQRFLEDYRLRYYTVSELAERFGVSRRTAHKWIDRFEQGGESGFRELSRRHHGCPGQTDTSLVEELVQLRKAHPRWSPGKLLDLMGRGHPQADLPSVSTSACTLAAVVSGVVPVDDGGLRPLYRGEAYATQHAEVAIELALD